MSVSPGLGVTIPSGVSYYRITSHAFLTSSATYHPNVVNGAGAVRSRHGARYNPPGATTVYLAESVATCFAERMFYFHREVLSGLDSLHLAHAPLVPPFLQRFVLWDIVLQKAVVDVFDLTVVNAPSAGVFPCLLLNPSQDYHHLKEGRAAIQAAGYKGLRAPSTRDPAGGAMIVLFHDQSGNLATIVPYEPEFRLLAPGIPQRTPFARHATDQLDYLAGEVRVIPPLSPLAFPATLSPYANWTVVNFNH